MSITASMGEMTPQALAEQILSMESFSIFPKKISEI
jgi:hypothetical protein